MRIVKVMIDTVGRGLFINKKLNALQLSNEYVYNKIFTLWIR